MRVPAGSTTATNFAVVLVKTNTLRLRCKGICDDFLLSLPVKIAENRLIFGKNIVKNDKSMTSLVSLARGLYLKYHNIIDYSGEPISYRRSET